jgi:CRISPR-associated protein Csy1
LDAALLLPMVHAGSAELARCRQTYAANLLSLRTVGLPRWRQRPQQVFSLERSNFLLAYQGGDDLPLQQGYASILGEMIDLAEPGLREPLLSTFIGGRRLRVGFVCQWFYTSTVGTYFERWITQLDRTRFEVYVYYTGHTDDALTTRIRARCDHFVRLHAAVHENARQIKRDGLDALVHLEVGMSTGSHLLAAMRLAPVQCAAWGHPVTTGSDAIDYYFSCRLMEPEGYAAHYAETVILLEGIGVDFALPTIGKPLARNDLGLPAAGRLYFCPQSLFKIHPDMDDLLAGIVSMDAGAVLVFFQAGARAVTLAFADRLSAKLRQRGINARGQIKFLPRMDNETFRRALTVADVVLDTVHWSGGGTSLDAMAGDVPVVTLPGGYMRGRQTTAMLQVMQLTDLIAVDVEDYVRKAIDVASDASLNAGLRHAIAVRKAALFEQSDLSTGFAEALYAAATSR